MADIAYQMVFHPRSLDDTQPSTGHDFGQTGRRYLPCPNKGGQHSLLQALANAALSKGRNDVTSSIQVSRERSREACTGKVSPVNPTRFCTNVMICWEAQGLQLPRDCGPGRPGDPAVIAAAAVRTMPNASVDVHRAAGLVCVQKTRRRASAG